MIIVASERTVHITWFRGTRKITVLNRSQLMGCFRFSGEDNSCADEHMRFQFCYTSGLEYFHIHVMTTASE